MALISVNGRTVDVDAAPDTPAPVGAARSPRDDRNEVRLRHGAVRRLHRARRRGRGAILRAAARRARRQAHHDHRGTCRRIAVTPCSAPGSSSTFRNADTVNRDRSCPPRRCSRSSLIRAMRISMPPWPGTSADAAPIRASARRFIERRSCSRRAGTLQVLTARDRTRVRRATAGDAAVDTGRRDFCRRTAGLGGGLVLAMTVPAFGGRVPSRRTGGRRRAGRAQRVAQDRCGRFDHRPRRSLRDGTGRVHGAAHAARRGARGRVPVIRIVAAPAGDAYVNAGNGGQITGTSNSVTDAWEKLRTAGAQGAHMLIAAAADKMAHRSGAVPRAPRAHRERPRAELILRAARAGGRETRRYRRKSSSSPGRSTR